jgi:putative transposase
MSVYLHAFETGSNARAGIGRRFEFRNRIRPHNSMGVTPDMCHEQNRIKAA